jgi:hypothetical protein
LLVLALKQNQGWGQKLGRFSRQSTGQKFVIVHVEQCKQPIFSFLVVEEEARPKIELLELMPKHKVAN